MARQKKLLGALAIASLVGNAISTGLSLNQQSKAAKLSELSNNFKNNIDYNSQLNQVIQGAGLDDEALDALNNKTNPLNVYRCGGRKRCRNGKQLFFDRLDATRIINKNRI